MTTEVAPAPPAAQGRAVRGVGVLAVAGAACVLILVLGAVHLSQGTAGLAAGEVARALLGQGEDEAVAILVASRLPRLLAGILVGLALGVAGAVLQSVARNPLASPDTMGVNAGAHFAITVVAAAGLALPLALSGVLAFVGGLGGAALVLLLARGGATGPTRLILAGATISLAIQAMTMLLLVLKEEETTGLYAWGSGSIVQSGMESVARVTPAVVLGLIAALLIAHRLDLLALGDDAASVLGIPVLQTRVAAVLVSVFLSAAAVTVAGPVGFVGLCAPAIVRLLTPLVPGLQRHRALLPLAGLAGVIVVLGADVLLRAVLGGAAGVEVPTGVVTSIFGAVVLIVLARRLRDSGATRRTGAAASGRPRTTRWTVVLATVLLVLLAGAALAGMLLGDRLMLTGDLVNYVMGDAGRIVTASVTERSPRVFGAVLAGAAFGLAGTVIQGVARNPLAEPSTLGITAGAGVGAVGTLTLLPGAGVWGVTLAGAAGALIAFAIVYLASYRRGLNSDRLVLVGIGFAAGAGALTTAIVIVADPWNVAFALTWLSGSTYGRIWSQMIPVVVALTVMIPFVARRTRDLDVLSLDDDVPRVLGVHLERTRMLLLVAAALLTSTAVGAVGVVGFVGLVAPHAARALVGGRHTHVLLVAPVLGALLVSVADTVGRTVISPGQIPAGIITALVGAPYFVYLLWRTRGRERA
ncbi:siderophore ABC transporter permease CdtC [Georgenia halophila]|uniref:Siderophore ABC transporter permease CdtC n=1 Tax=Georgenia halophila TaxID=620889 RepID=A0ABP8L6D4_9MICO